MFYDGCFYSKCVLIRRLKYGNIYVEIKHECKVQNDPKSSGEQQTQFNAAAQTTESKVNVVNVIIF